MAKNNKYSGRYTIPDVIVEKLKLLYPEIENKIYDLIDKLFIEIRDYCIEYGRCNISSFGRFDLFKIDYDDGTFKIKFRFVPSNSLRAFFKESRYVLGRLKTIQTKKKKTISIITGIINTLNLERDAKELGIEIDEKKLQELKKVSSEKYSQFGKIMKNNDESKEELKKFTDIVRKKAEQVDYGFDDEEDDLEPIFEALKKGS